MSIIKDSTVKIVAGYFPKITTLALVVLSFAMGLVWAYVISPTTFVDGDPVQLEQAWQDEWVLLLEARYVSYVDRNAQIDEYILDLLEKVDNPEEIILRNGLNTDPQFVELVQQAQGNAGTAPDRPTITSNYVIPFLVTLGFGLIFAVLKALGSFLIVLLTTNRNKSVGDAEAPSPSQPIKGEEKRATEVTTATAPVPAPVTRSMFGTRNPPLVSTEIAPSSTETNRYGTPIIRKVSVYRAGFGNYDDSFNIETDAGLYYGEAGGSVAEKIGDGVSAIEIWMFDKDEFVNTPTAVIASPHLFTNPVARNKLQAKGNIVLAQVGQKVILETKALYLEARIVSVDYDPTAPFPNSVFTNMTIEVSAWSKLAFSSTPASLSSVGAPLPPMPTSPMRAPTGTLPTQGQGVPSFPASQPVGGNLPLTPPPPFNAPMPNTTTAFNPAPPSSPMAGSRPEDLFGASSSFGTGADLPDDPFGGTGDFTPIQ